MRAQVGGLILGLAVLGGCGNASPAVAPIDRPSIATSSPARGNTHDSDSSLSAPNRSVFQKSGNSRSAPEAFRDRAQLASCGKVVLTPAGRLNPRTIDCLKSKAASGGAELVVLQRTVEGDPIVRYYRVGPNIDGLEIFSDNTQDKFGRRTWAHELSSLEDLAKVQG